MTTQTVRRLKVSTAWLAALLTVVVVTGIFVARTDWFRGFVRDKTIAAVEKSTGGKVELAEFRFDWTQLRAVLRGFVLHGTESAGSEPLFKAREIVVDLRLLSVFRQRRVDIASLRVDQPSVNLIVFPDGKTNVPRPDIPEGPSDRTGLETIVDLAIGRFSLTDGSLQVNERKTPFSGRGGNLKADLFYEVIQRRYRGTISTNPLIVQYAGGERLEIAANMPVVIEADRIELDGASLKTANSQFTLTASIDNLKNPNVAIQADGRLDVPELAATIGKQLNLSKQAPRSISLALDASTMDQRLEIRSAKVDFGESSAEASGFFKNVALEDGSLDLRAHLAIGEISRILGQSTTFKADGAIDLEGEGRIQTVSDYTMTARLTGERLSFREGPAQIANSRLNSKITIVPRRIRLDPIRLDVIGGSIVAKAEIADLDRYDVDGTINRIQSEQLLAALGARGTAWGATVGGDFRAQGSLQASVPATSTVDLTLAANGKGIPLAGRVSVAYSRASDSVDVGQSFLVLPASRIDFSGALNRRLNLHVSSRNLDDFVPALAFASASVPSQLPVRLDQGGTLTLDTQVTGSLDSPTLTGSLRVSRFAADTRHFDLLTADLSATKNSARVQNGLVTRGPLQARVDGSIGLDGWRTKSNLPLAAAVDVRNADAADLLALAGQSEVPVRGALTLNANIAGTLGDPQGNAVIALRNGAVYGESLDALDGRIVLGNEQVTLSSLDVVSGEARLKATGVFAHPPDSYNTGRLSGHVESNQVALSRIALIRKERPGLDGSLQLNVDVEAVLLAQSQVELSVANGTIGVQGLKQNGDDLGNLQARVQTEGRDVAFSLTSNLAQSSIQATGRTTLSPGYPTRASINVQDLRIERVLSLIGAPKSDARGRLSAQGVVGGTWSDPTAQLDITVTQGMYERQAIDRLTANVTYAPELVSVSNVQLQAGPNRLAGEGSMRHPSGIFSQGDLAIKLDSNSIQLAQLGYLQARRPGFGGVIDVSLDAAGAFDRRRTADPVRLSKLQADIKGANLTLNGQNYGAFHLDAKQAGTNVAVNLESTLAQSNVRGTAQIQLTSDYPVTGEISIQNLHYRELAKLGAKQSSPQDVDFDALLEGNLNVSGPMMRPTAMTGSAQFTKVELYTTAQTGISGKATRVALTNDGAVSLVVTQNGVQIQNAHWKGPSTDVAVAGGMKLQPALELNLTVKADANLRLLQEFDRKIRSDGALALNGTLKGPLDAPVVSGRMELKDASYQQTGMLNGISHANGAIIFSGNSARVENLSAESGGGTLNLSGGVNRVNGIYRFDLGARAREVRIQTPVEASIVANGTFKLSGSSENSLLSGDVNVRSVSFNKRTDFGSILSSTSPPRETPGGDRGFLDRMNLMINAKIGSSTTFRTALAENLQAMADVTVRGTASSPGALGRVEVTRGELLFFGTKYKVNEGTVSFYNPVKIEPILNLNLATTARGVDVVLVVTGPIENMNLAYQSDPPLQFSEIVALLAAGKLPTSDPILLAHQPATPSQNLPQMGASALVSAAVTNPVAGRLQRVFGVTQLKIDPTFTSGAELPQARLTLQQQITSDLTFTYVTNLTRADPQIVRVEWVLDSDWSAIATRQENGMVGVDLFYKRRFQ